MGAASRDLEPSDPRGWRLGGTVSYAALCAARLGLCVHALIGADTEARDAHELETLRGAGVDLVVVPLDHGPVFENRQDANSRVQIVHATSDAVPASALPEKWQTIPAVLVGPVAGELRDEWAAAMPADAFVALAWQGLVRELRAGEQVRLRPLEPTPLVRRADVLFVSAEDVAAGGPALDSLLVPEQELFVTHGDMGAIHLLPSRLGERRQIRYVSPRPRRSPVDTTGAGDVFLAAYLAARLSAPQLVGGPDEWRLDAIAAASASLNVAAPVLADVPTLAELRDALLMPRP